MTSVDVDFNARGRGGLLHISRRRADGDLAVGDRIEVYDGADPEMRYEAVVESFDEQGRGFARVEWESVSTPDLRCAYWTHLDPYWWSTDQELHVTTEAAKTGDMTMTAVSQAHLMPAAASQ